MSEKQKASNDAQLAALLQRVDETNEKRENIRKDGEARRAAEDAAAREGASQRDQFLRQLPTQVAALNEKLRPRQRLLSVAQSRTDFATPDALVDITYRGGGLYGERDSVLHVSLRLKPSVEVKAKANGEHNVPLSDGWYEPDGIMEMLLAFIDFVETRGSLA